VVLISAEVGGALTLLTLTSERKQGKVVYVDTSSQNCGHERERLLDPQ
jgi:hypothetical protein